MTLVDSILAVSVDEQSSFNELQTLLTLRAGMDFLFASVDRIERPRREEDLVNNMQCYAFGRDPKTPPEFLLASASIFAWYSISAINYARLVGFLKGISDREFTREDIRENMSIGNKRRVKEKCDSYVSAIPELHDVLKWRNKVAAHFALTDPRGDDNPATLEATIANSIGYNDGRYKAGIFQICFGSEATGNFSSELPSWSLTEVHSALSARYLWPS